MIQLTSLCRKFMLRYYLVFLTVFSILAGNYLIKYPDMVFTSDSEGYYMYIAAPFFNGGFANYKPYSPVYTTYPGTDKIFTKYTYGTALFEAPFALLANIVYVIKEHNHDSHGRFGMYGMAVLYAFIFYSMFSLWMLRRYLEQRFNPVWVMLALCSLYLGTNWVFYTVKEPGNSHVVSLFLLTCWMMFVPSIYKEPSRQNFILAGLLFGLVSLVRPTNAVAILYPFFVNLPGEKPLNLKSRLQFLGKNSPYVLLAAAVMLSVWLPQMWYWHSISGHWLMYSYDKEGFDNWSSPKILNVLFDVQNGLLVYAPILIMPLIGLVYGVRQRRREAYGILLSFSLLLYLFASWHTWSFGGAFGHRCFVDWMCFLTIPFCWFWEEIVAPSRAARRWAPALALFLIYLSLGLGYLYQWPWERPGWTWEKLGWTVLKLFPF